MSTINGETLRKLMELAPEDEDVLDLVLNALLHFEEYHQSIYEMETKIRLYTADMLGAEGYRELRSSLDRVRTGKHNVVIADIRILNRLAESEGLPLVYDGVVSEDRPYRRELANAVLSYVEDVIKERI